jgi:hypothetical protein
LDEHVTKPLISSANIAELHRETILSWKKSTPSIVQVDFLERVEKNHAFNYQLWHAEDRARREDMGSDYVYTAKREIDACNQQRNNCMEAMDNWLFTHLSPADSTYCPVHSETPGMMIDRLSILALKAYHMELQTLRSDVEPAHREACQGKLSIIKQQQQQLYNCLDQLLAEVKEKTRTFRVYHQFKMYNDPTLNPQLYTSKN